MNEENKDYLTTKEHMERANGRYNGTKIDFKSRGYGRLTHIAGILLTVAFSLYIVFHAVLTIATWVKGQPYTASEIAIASILRLLFNNTFKTEIGIGVLAFTLGTVYDIVVIVFSSNLIVDSKKSLAEYKKSTGPMITYLCFYTVWLVVPIIQLCNSGAIIGLIYLLVVVACIALVIADLVKASKLLVSEPTQTAQGSTNEAAATTTNISNNNAATTNIMKELEKLVALKESGALTEEEFTKLKQDLLNNK